MIDLAPGHKIGLLVTNPVLLAGGTIGYGEAIPAGLDVKRLGGVVVGPVLHHSAAGSAPPRLAELPGGLVLASGLQHRGVNDVRKRFANQWARLGVPVIVQVAETRTQSLVIVLQQVATIAAVAGIELVTAQPGDADTVKRTVQTALQHCDVPVWVKVPLAEAARLAAAAVEAGAVGVVIGQPPIAAALRQPAGSANAAFVQGALYGPLSFSLTLAALLAVSKLALPAAVIACGGIHTEAQARSVLGIAGVQALQIDSALWIEPGLPGRLAAALDTTE